jgi:hypothetical protein
MAIHMVKVRARIQIGSMSAATPPIAGTGGNHILSFGVERARGRISTFNASLKVKHGDVSGTIQGDSVKIYAGTTGGMPLIYTGIVKTANVGPCREDPGFVILNISGEDVLTKLNGKKFTRRCRSSKGVWISIEGIVRPGIRSGRFQYQPGEPWMDTTGGDLKNIGQPVQTKQLVDQGKTTETQPPTQHQQEEAVIDVTYVSQDEVGAGGEGGL